MLLIAGAAGLRVNLTPSAALGLWRMAAPTEPLVRGQQVFVCLTGSAAALGLKRGYLRPGSCPNGLAPLLKTVGGLPGQRVLVTQSVSIDGLVLPNSRPLRSDAQSRRLDTYDGGTIKPGFVYLHSPKANGYDSRYFGPVPVTAVEGLAVPLLTFDLDGE